MLRLETITVSDDRLVAVVRLDDVSRAYTDPALMERVVARFPDLPSHPCVNARGPRFSCVMDRTSLPHLLEHVVIDMQADAYTIARQGKNAADEEPPLLVGVTKWVSREEGLAQVQVSYFDDLVALRAFRDAVAFLNSLE